jgi:signal transduction histidine kinase
MDASAASRATVAAAGTALAFASSVLVATIAEGAHETTYGSRSAWFAALEAVVGIGLLAAGVLLLWEGTTATLGVLTLVACAAWFAPVWRGWEGGAEVVRSLGLVVAFVLPAALVAVAAHVPPPPKRIWRLAALLPLALATAAAVGLALVRDPIRDPYCWSDCTVNLLLAHDDVGAAHDLMRVVLALGAGSGVAAALVCALRLVRLSAAALRGSGPALAATGLAGFALAAYALALDIEPRETPGRPLYAALFVGRAAALLALAATLVWLVLRPRLVRGQVTRFALDLERSASVGGLEPVLAAALGDPGLRLRYRVGPGERVVDAEGRSVRPSPSARISPIVEDDGVVALVESSVASVQELERELGPAAHLALGNERLRAETLARLAEVTDSRARIVETADAARRRMERDLHDGAQQQMLALTYDLRVAVERAEVSGDRRTASLLRTALDGAVSASRELRDVAHGIFPGELAASGLVPALESQADLFPLRLTVELEPGRRYRPEVEATAYALVAETAEEGGELHVALAEADGMLRVTLERDHDWDARVVRLEDRVGAVRGDVRVAGRRVEALLPLHRAGPSA